jgi:hypothetical protein
MTYHIVLRADGTDEAMFAALDHAEDEGLDLAGWRIYAYGSSCPYCAEHRGETVAYIERTGSAIYHVVCTLEVR